MSRNFKGDNSELNRRQLLTRGGLMAGAVLGGPALLSACTDSDDTTVSANTEATTASVASVSEGTAQSTGDYSGLEGKTVGLAGVAVASEAPARAAQRVQELADEFGFQVEVFDGDGDYKSMSDTMITWANSGTVDAIISDVVAPSLITEGMQAAEEAEIPVGGIFAGFEPGISFDVASNEWQSESRVGTYIIERMGGEGQIALLNWPNVPALRIRQSVIEAMLAFNEGIEIVANEVLTVPGQVPDAKQKTQSILTANPDLKCIWGGWDEVGVAASQEIIQQGREDSVFAVGIDGNEASFDAIRAGEPFSATCANDMATIAEVCLQQLGVMLEGGSPIANSIWVDAPFVAEHNVPPPGEFPSGQGLMIFYGG